MTERTPAWLRVTDVNGTIVFDCEHNGTFPYDWQWNAGSSSGSCANVTELCDMASWVWRAHPGSIVDGRWINEFNAFINS